MNASSRIPPLSFNPSNSIADQIVDRLALHLRVKFPDVFGDKTVTEIALIFSGLRAEIDRLCPQPEQEDC
jgi:hypothetical protein